MNFNKSMANFVTGKELEEAVYDIIFNAKKDLIILSPFIKLDGYFETLFKHYENMPDLHVMIGFGKNPDNPEKSFNRQSLEFFKQFPNISVVYIPDLHAKYYANETKGMLTSINLYDYSFKNNIEYGILFESSILGVDSMDKAAWNKTHDLFEENPAIFIRRPTFKSKMLGFSKNYVGSKVMLDQIDILINGKHLDKVYMIDFEESEDAGVIEKEERITREEYEELQKSKDKADFSTKKKEGKMVSATKLGKQIGLSYKEVRELMVEKDWITGNAITDKGKENGLDYRQSKEGNYYVVYPETLVKELN